MRTADEVERTLATLMSDDRYWRYPPANTYINAPLALIQQDLEARIMMLRWALGHGPLRYSHPVRTEEARGFGGILKPDDRHLPHSPRSRP